MLPVVGISHQSEFLVTSIVKNNFYVLSLRVSHQDGHSKYATHESSITGSSLSTNVQYIIN